MSGTMQDIIVCMVTTTTFLVILVDSFQTRVHDRWESVSVRYGLWYSLPPYQSTAFEEGYTRLNDVCKTDNFHGFLFQRGSNTKSMPIYDLNGNLAGIQTAIPGNMRGYNSRNESIDLPPSDIMPPILKGLRDKKGILYYTVTAYFKHPRLICSPISSEGANPGRGLYIQIGYNPETDFMHIPKEEKHLSPQWTKGNCLPMMGNHYFRNMSRDLPCEKLYPVFLMYDIEGNLGAFGWAFQGRPHNFYSDDGMGWFHIIPSTYPFLYDTSQLPPCMMQKNFQVFGIHIYLQEPTKLLCEPVTLDLIEQAVTPRTGSKTRRPPQRTLIASIDNDKQPVTRNSGNYEIDISDFKSLGTNVSFNKSYSLQLCLLVLLLASVERSIM